MNNEKLIEIVRGHISLYDLSTSEYSDANSKEKIWKEIGKEMKQPGMLIINKIIYQDKKTSSVRLYIKK